MNKKGVEENNEAVSSQLVDLAKFIDSEWLVDIMSEMYRGKIRGKPYRLIYEMNKRTNITVRTSVGDSKSIETKENMAQGSIEAAILSSSNLSQGVEDFFQTSEYELSYGPLKLLPQSWQDDMMGMCQFPLSA